MSFARALAPLKYGSGCGLPYKQSSAVMKWVGGIIFVVLRAFEAYTIVAELKYKLLNALTGRC